MLDDRGDGLATFHGERISAARLEGGVWDPYAEYRARTHMPATGFGPVELLEALDGSRLFGRLDLAMNRAGVGVAVWSFDANGRARMFR